mmetsp:Transcript_5110/g.12290  ORF Transcript_5110/g.12290 Transcript_5110/m.12290 type:complete len:849 (-) Transcript_5110:132-2678(-)|eukprot:CAMPEP_0173424686 /NCGR_PEP_ID=MMETSP1357-20121228/4553_1 /TAXON_ID=77926 /ORGANISM="Hemiselmis rufescens, Strain PCC563" /LENGTH=848 /DNA_ID=CAMNT_0014387967 /DNA_START=28 /DNA_END=2574 /DNA_ORIENTATION=-
MLGRLRDFVSDNAVLVDSHAEEAKLKEISPHLLHAGESVVYAFTGRGGNGRDHYYLTDRRLLVKDVTGITGKQVKYRSYPFRNIKAWSVSTAGGGFDSDSELEIWCSGMDKIEIEFSKDKVDLFSIQKFLNHKILPKEEVHAVIVPGNCEPGGKFQCTVAGQTMEVQCPVHNGPGDRISVAIPATNPGTYSPPTCAMTQEKASACSNFMNWLGSNATQVDPRELEQRLKTSPTVLDDDERIEMAFHCGRDFLVLSSKRLLIVDPRGITGKKVVYKSILWKCIKAFMVETAGTFDMDAELVLWTNISGLTVQQDLRRGQCDVLAVQRFFADRILGMDAKPYTPGADVTQGQQDPGASMFAWLGDDNRQIDASQANMQFHSNPPILQGSEVCEMAFTGRRDLVLFTTKRLIRIDVQGWTGKKKSYLSIPWSSVKNFGVKSAGSFLDKDSEMMIWTDIMYVMGPPTEDCGRPGQVAEGMLDMAGLAGGIMNMVADSAMDAAVDDGDGPPPDPGMSFLEFDFQKDRVDLMGVQRYLAARILPTGLAGLDVPVPASVMAPSTPGALEGLINWMGDDGHALDAHTLNAQLGQAGLLIEGEAVAMGFKAGRDTFVLTSKRVLVIDVQGFTGKRIAYESTPYSSIRAFSVESAGTFDRDAEIKIYTRNTWTRSEIAQDLRKGRADVLAIQNYLAMQVIGKDDGSSALGPDPVPTQAPASVGGAEGFLNWLGDDAHQINAQSVNDRLHQDTPILLADEVVDFAFKCGRDMYVHTSKRMLFVDVQGWTGKKVEYMTYPLKYCTGFEIETAGYIDRDCDIRVYMDCPSIGCHKQDIRKNTVDIFYLQDAIAAKLARFDP